LLRSKTNLPQRLNILKDFTDAMPEALTMNTAFAAFPFGVNALGKNTCELWQKTFYTNCITTNTTVNICAVNKNNLHSLL